MLDLDEAGRRFRDRVANAPKPALAIAARLRSRQRHQAAVLTVIVGLAATSAVLAFRSGDGGRVRVRVPAGPLRTTASASSSTPSAMLGAPTKAGQLPEPTRTLLVQGGQHETQISIAGIDSGTLTRTNLPGVPHAFYGFVATGHDLVALSSPNYPAGLDGLAFSFPHTPPAPGDIPVSLGPASFMSAAPEPGHLWLQTANKHVRELDAGTGKIVVADRVGPGRMDAAVTGGLVMEQAGLPGLVLWDPLTGHKRPIGPGQNSSFVTATGDRVAWSGGACLPDCVHVTDTRHGTDTTFNAPGAAYEGHHAAFSPDGRWLVIGLLTGRSSTGGPIFRAATISITTGKLAYLGASNSQNPVDFALWSPDSRWAFFTFGGRLNAWRAGTTSLIGLGDFAPEADLPI